MKNRIIKIAKLRRRTPAASPRRSSKSRFRTKTWNFVSIEPMGGPTVWVGRGRGAAVQLLKPLVHQHPRRQLSPFAGSQSAPDSRAGSFSVELKPLSNPSNPFKLCTFAITGVSTWNYREIGCRSLPSCTAEFSLCVSNWNFPFSLLEKTP